MDDQKKELMEVIENLRMPKFGRIEIVIHENRITDIMVMERKKFLYKKKDDRVILKNI